MDKKLCAIRCLLHIDSFKISSVQYEYFSYTNHVNLAVRIVGCSYMLYPLVLTATLLVIKLPNRIN